MLRRRPSHDGTDQAEKQVRHFRRVFDEAATAIDAAAAVAQMRKAAKISKRELAYRLGCSEAQEPQKLQERRSSLAAQCLAQHDFLPLGRVISAWVFRNAKP
jgi:predicted exporter